MRRRLNRTNAVLGTAILGGWVPMSQMKVRSPVVFSNHSAVHRWSAYSAAPLLVSSDELMSNCAAVTNEWLDLRCRAFPAGGQVSAEWSRCPGSMARLARNSADALRRNSAGWLPTDEYLRHASLNNLPVLAIIQPAGRCVKRALSLACRSLESEHLHRFALQ